MRRSQVFLFLLALSTAGCAHGPQPAMPSASTVAALQTGQEIVSRREDVPPAATGGSAEPEAANLMLAEKDSSVAGAPVSDSPAPRNGQVTSSDERLKDWEGDDFSEDGGAEKKAGIADPLEPFNRAMFHVNDKLYFWVLKPVAQGYSKVVPEGARVGVSNFFSNLAFPIRFVNCLLQANFRGAASEIGRFVVNTLWGIGGFLDPASGKEIALAKEDGDFGQTLGVYGLGQGFFVNWPVLGPSSARDTVGIVGDLFLSPLTYANPWEVATGAKAYEKVNATSLAIGDYESLKEAAIDPYVAIRDAYVQYRLNKVKKGGVKGNL